MKIVHVVEPLAGGIVTFIKSLVQNLPYDQHLIVHGEREQVISFADVKKQFVSTNVKFLRWKSAQRSLRFQKDTKAAMELYTILRRLKSNHSVDIVHLHSSKSGFIGRVVCRMLGLQNQVVYTPNGAPFLVGTNHASNFLYKKLEKLAAGFGGQVVCCSASEQYAYKLAGIDALTINNGTFFAKTGTSFTKAKATGKFQVVTSGRIVNQKDPVFFNSIAAYFEEFDQFEFLWIGDGVDRHLLTAKNIRVTGWLDKKSVDNIVFNADMYLSTAHFEGLPFAVLEALALKKPVLLTDCVGNKDLVIKGLNGDLFKNKNEAVNKILQFYNNSSMMGVMGEYSGDYCKNSFAEEDTYCGYKLLYQKAVFSQKNKSIVNLN